MKTLYLHIGHYKTGTSAIQSYCSANADTLAANGLYYPKTARPKNNVTNHGRLSLSLAARHGFTPPPWYVDTVSADDAFAELTDELKGVRQNRILVSSEEFVQLALCQSPSEALSELKQKLSQFDVRIILCIREPFSLLKSWFDEVNKGPRGTRNFPVFFSNIRPEFLSQDCIHKRYAEAFGAENVTVLPYRSLGMDHIRDFLEALDYEPLPERGSFAKNTARDLKMQEFMRLAKPRDHSYAEATLSRVGPMKDLVAKVERINREFSTVSALATHPIPSELSLVSIFTHYKRLIEPLAEYKCANSEEAVLLRDLAISIENDDPELAIVLMETAQVIRPSGQIIKKKLADYLGAFLRGR